MSTLTLLLPVMNFTPDATRVKRGRTADGVLVADISDLVFAVVTSRTRHLVASAWLLKPFDKVDCADFYSHHRTVEDKRHSTLAWPSRPKTAAN